MLIKDITAEEIKYYINEVKLNLIDQLGGFEKYLKTFFDIYQSASERKLMFDTIRVNSELVSRQDDRYYDEEDEIVEELAAKTKKSIKNDFKTRTRITQAYLKSLDLVCCFHSMSDMDHKYFIKTGGSIVPGLETESIDFKICKETIPYLPLLAESHVETGNYSFDLLNSDEAALKFAYPFFCVYVKGIDEPLIELALWEEDIDVLGPEVKDFMEVKEDMIKYISKELEDKLLPRLKIFIENR